MFQDPVSMYFIRPVGFVSKLTALIHTLFEWSYTINPNFSELSRGHQQQQDGNTHSTAVQGQAKCPSKACISFPTEDAWHGGRAQDHSTVLSPRTEPRHVLWITHRNVFACNSSVSISISIQWLLFQNLSSSFFNPSKLLVFITAHDKAPELKHVLCDKPAPVHLQTCHFLGSLVAP